MSPRTDSAIRVGALVAGVALTLAILVAVDFDAMSRTGRFAVLAAIGAGLTLLWPAASAFAPMEARTPLLPRAGMYPRRGLTEVSPPAPAMKVTLPSRYRLRIGPSVIAFFAALVVAAVTGAGGYALAGDASGNVGGTTVYVVFGASLLIALRSLWRVATARSAVTLGDESITIGTAVGHGRPLSIARNETAALETSAAHPTKVAIVREDGRRFEIATAHLNPPSLAGDLAATWPEKRWLELVEIDPQPVSVKEAG